MSRDAQMTEEGKQEWMALDRDVFNSWCIIGQNLCLSSHSQIAAFLVDSYKNKVEPGGVCCVQCGSSLSWVCVSCHAQPTLEQQKQLCRQGRLGTSAHIASQNDVQRHSIQGDADQKQKRQQHLKKQHQQTPQQLKKKRILQKQTEQRHHLQQEDQDQHRQQHQDKQHQYHQQPQDQEQQHHFQQQDQDQQQQHHQQDQNQQQQHQQYHQQLCVGSEKTTDKKGQKRQSLEEEGISFSSDSVREGEPIICIKTEDNADLPVLGKSQSKGEEPDNSHSSSSHFPLAFKVDLETPHQVSNSEFSSCNTSTRARKRKGKFRVDLETSCRQGSNKAGDGDFSICTTGKRKYKGKLRVGLKETPLQVSHCDSVVDLVSSCNANPRKGKHEGMVTVDLDETPYQGSDRDSDVELSSCNNNAGTRKQEYERRLSQDGILKCEACSKTFATVKYLKRHQLIHKGVKPYMCHVCGRGFTYSTYLKNHMLVHSDHRAYRCSTCGKSFTRTSQLKRHARIHTGEKPHVCGVCAAAFCQAGNLKQHLLTHTGEKPYVCDMCGTGFAQVGTLKQHKLVHAGQKDHACRACGKAFYTAAKLNYHVKHEHEEGAGGDEGAVTTATEARPKKFVCEECGSSATSAGNLKKHKALHSSEKLVCDVCSKTFSFACNLKTHKLTHYGEKKVACAMCSKAFYTQGDLTRHMLVHSGERKHCCDVCWRSFSQLSNLKQHKIKVHKLLPPVSSVKSKKEDET